MGADCRFAAGGRGLPVCSCGIANLQAKRSHGGKYGVTAYSLGVKTGGLPVPPPLPPCHCEALAEAIPLNVRADFLASPFGGMLARLLSRD
jgi:hypothetical protein